MNEHDSERIAGLLTADGYVPTEEAAEARASSCSTRARSARTPTTACTATSGTSGRSRSANPRLRIVVAGCLAQKDQGHDPAQGARGSTSSSARTRCPSCSTCCAARRDRGPADGRARVRPRRSRAPCRPLRERRVPRVGLDRAGVRQRLHVLHRAARARAAALAPDRRHPGRGAGAGARSGVVEVTLLGQNVNTYGRDLTVPGLGPQPAVRRPAASGERGRRASARIRFTSPHPHDFTPDVIEAMAEMRAGVRAHPLPAAVGLGPRAQGDAALVPPRALPGLARADPRGDPGHRGVDRHHRGVPRRDRGGLRATRSTSSSARRLRPARTCSSTRHGPARGPRRCDGPAPESRSSRSASTGWSRCRSGSRSSGRARRSGRTLEVLVEGAGKKGGSTQARTPDEPHRARRRRARARDVPRTRASPRRAAHHLDRRARAGAGAGRGRVMAAPVTGADAAPRARRVRPPSGKTEAGIALARAPRRGDRLGRLDARVPGDGRRHGQADRRAARARAAPPHRRRGAVGAVHASRGSRSSRARRSPRSRRGAARRCWSGGSGLYLRAVVDDLEFPGTDPGTRAELERRGRGAGRRPAVRSASPRSDPAAAAKIEPGNVRRTVRALEVAAAHRPTVLELRRRRGTCYEPERVRAAGIERPRRCSRARIADRVRAMLERGLARRGARAGRARVRRLAHLEPGHRLR